MNCRMKRFILLITTICIAKMGLSQTDYRNGFIITNARDTLLGQVNYRVGVKSYKSCDFKRSKASNVMVYEPNSIIGYGFENDKFYQSREISIKDQPSKVVFLEVIVRGLVSLYRFEDTYFIEKEGNGLHQLVNETKEVFANGRKLVTYTNQYKGTINMLVFDCDEISAKVGEIGLDEKALTTLIVDYNRCKGVPSIAFKAKKPWTKAVVGIAGGINFSKLVFETNPDYVYLAGAYEVSKSPMVEISLEVFSPRISERISFYSDILYLTSTYYNYSIVNNISSTERNYVTIELQQLKIPIGFRYTFPKREFTPYVSMGMSSTIHISSDAKWVQEVESNNVVKTNEKEAVTIKNTQLGLWGGFGVIKNVNQKINAFVELRYEQTNGIAPFTVNSSDLKSKITNFQVLIGIRTK
jgi:hypothetical protein